MRIIWNLVSGEDAKRPQIRSTSAMRSAMEFIDKLDSHNVYNCLANFTEKLSDSEFDKRCKEEIAKAKQILDEDGNLRKYKGSCKKEDGSDYQTWEEIIIDAEQSAFFKGAIRFLFTKENIGDDWDDFDTKWGNAQKYFDKEGVAKEYQKSAKLLRALLSRIDIFELWFGNYKDFWSEMLLSGDYYAIHELLIGSVVDVKEGCEDWIKDEYLLQELLSKYKSWHILKNWHGYNVLTRYSQRRSDATSYKEIVVLNDLRNKLLSHKKIDVSLECKVAKTACFYGWNINFKYNSHFFQWWGNPNDKELDVYLLKENENYCERQNPTPGKNTDEGKYFCFRVTEHTSTEDFLKKLNCLIQQACAEEAGKDCFNDCPNEKRNHMS